MSSFGIGKHLATTALAVGTVVWSFPAEAQIAPRQGTTTIPQGSPLDPSASQQSGNTSSQDVTGSQQGTIPSAAIIQPRDLSEPGQGLLTTEQLLLARERDEEQRQQVLIKKPADPSEFELYVERVLGRKLPRFGSELVLPALRDFATPATATVPPDYVVQPGDKIAISLVGSVEGGVTREVNNDGNIFLQGIGAVKVAGVRYADLRERIAAAVGRQYRGYDVAVTISELRGIRVYVTGFANNPGAFTVSSLSTMANAVLQAGGPNGGGSFRTVKLIRNGMEVAEFDLYELLRGGSRVNDATLQNEDVLFIPPAGPQVAVIGSVNEEAIYEAKPGESVADMLRAAGGPNTLGDRSRLILYRTDDPSRIGPQEIAIANAPSFAAEGGDILQILSKGSLVQPTDRQSVVVRIEGEVNRPGNYYVSPNTPSSHIIALAGGLTQNAYAYGAKLTRQSVKLQQQESYREAIKQLEMSLAAAPLISDPSLSQVDRQSQIAAAQAVLDRMRRTEPDGRVVMPLEVTSVSLPAQILMENNDAIFIPRRPTTVGVFGAVYRPASFLIDDRPKKVKDYVELAGGMLRSADKKELFVVRANGAVLSRRNGANSAYVYPGDVVFVPVRTEPNLFWTRFKDISQTLFSLGLSAATVVSVTK